MKLPAHQSIRGLEEHHRQLAAWLAEREIDGLLKDSDDEYGGSVSIRYDRQIGEVVPGDVYVLTPSALNQTPVYVVVLEKTGDPSRWRVVPFSRYATPAVPGEWATGLRDSPLHVLCFWNVRETSAQCFLPGAAKKLSPRMLKNIHSVYRLVMFGELADESLTKRLGPPIRHPADPRHEYLDEDRLRIDHQLRGHQAVGFEGVGSGSVPWRMAAEGRPRYGSKED